MERTEEVVAVEEPVPVSDGTPWVFKLCPPEHRLRKDANNQGAVLLIYHMIMNAAVFVVVMVSTFFQIFQQILSGADAEPNIDMIVDSVMEASGWGYLLAVAIGLVILLLWKKPSYIRHTIFQTNQKMGMGSFFAVLCLAMAPQLVTQVCYMGSSWLLDFLGADPGALDQLGAVDMDTWTMVFYIGILAPISEELLFRGLLLRTIAPYGKGIAVVGSAVMFGLYHGNLMQTPYAFLVGLALGYVALEYNVFWAILLHIFNNLVFAMLLPQSLATMSAEFADLIMWVLMIAFFLGAVGILLANWEELKFASRSEQLRKWQLRGFFGAPVMIVMMVICGLNILLTTLMLFLA